MNNCIKKISFNYHQDERGTFQKIFDTTNDALTNFNIKQVNYVNTLKVNTLRGLHYQTGEFAEAKLFRIIAGSIQLSAFNYTT